MFGLIGEKFDSVQEAYNILKTKLKEKDVAYIGGSTFVVAEIL